MGRAADNAEESICDFPIEQAGSGQACELAHWSDFKSDGTSDGSEIAENKRNMSGNRLSY